MCQKIDELTKDLIEEVHHFGVFTIATLTKHASESDSRVLAAGISRRSFRDQYNQETGDSIALGRAKKAYWLKQNKKPIRNAMMG